MLILETIGMMVVYWLAFGASVAAMMFLLFGIAYLIGELPEWLKERFAKPSLRK